MKALVVYDSVFGNTEKIALAIGKIIESDVKKINDVTEEALKAVELLIVGSPTRGFRPTPAITNWIKGLPSNSLRGIRVASFDTRTSPEDVNSKFLKKMMNAFGYASKPIADSLSKKGGELSSDPAGFFVSASEGPLKEGEIERAEEWVITALKGRGK